MTIEAVLFDLDGTLHDRPSSLVGFLVDQWARWPALQVVPRDNFVVAFVALDENGHVWKDVVYERLIEQFGLRDVTADALLADYVANFGASARLFPDALATLEALKDEGLKLGIVTNGPTALQTSVIEACGLAPLMDVVLISEAEGIRKPDRRIFVRALAEIGVAADRCVFVGDNPVADIEGAQNAGMKTAWLVNNGFGRSAGSVGFRRYRELSGVLHAL